MKKRTIHRDQLASVMKYAGIAMAVLYMFLGFFMIAYGRQSFSMSPQYVFPFGVILVAYGLFRGFRTYSSHFKRGRRYENHSD